MHRFRPWQIRKFRSRNYRALAFFPLLFLRERDLIHNKTLVNHERIHFRQQLEMLIVPFYLLYFFNYCINIFRYRGHDRAYRNIIFEREAYAKEMDLNYLGRRRIWSWLRYV